MEFSARQIADLIGGTLDGDDAATVNRVSKIEEGTKGALSFLANPKYTEYIYSTKASVVIVNNTFTAEQPLEHSPTLIRVEDAYSSFAKLLDVYNSVQQAKPGREEPVFVHETATVGEDAYLGAFAYVGAGAKLGNNVHVYPGSYVGANVVVGDNTIIYAGVKIYANCVIGKHCTLHAGAIIGADGFGFAPNSENNYQKVPQIGNVVLEDHVEIGANTAVDRATLGHTTIRKGVKLDNLIQIAHNVDIGENTVIAAQTGIAGSTKLGKNMMVGGQVGIVGHLNLAEEVKIAAQSGIGHSIEEPGTVVQGSPAFAYGDYKRSYLIFRKLPELYKQINSLQKEIEALKNGLDNE